MPLQSRPPEDIFKDVCRFLRENPSKQREIAALAGVHQSTISRIKAGKSGIRNSEGLLKLCRHAGISTEIEIPELKPDPRECQVLLAAIGDVWDGTTRHAKALARLIRDLNFLARGQKNR